MTLSDKSNHLKSDQHKNKTKQQQNWCEGCGKYISDRTRHFQSEIHTLRRVNQDTRSAYSFAHSFAVAHTLGTQSGVEVSVNEKTYFKLKMNLTSSLEILINDLLRTNFFPRYKFQV